jgi:hypothetical protein
MPQLPIEIIEIILAHTEIDNIELNNQEINVKYLRFCQTNDFSMISMTR